MDLRFWRYVAILGLFGPILGTSPLAADEAGDAAGEAPPAPCQAPEAGQFDFWLGEWDLTWGEDGKGRNVITRVLGDCVIEENFDGTPSTPLVGRSYSVYNVRTGRWHQTWVDNQGGYLDFVGGLGSEGRMILSRDAMVEGQPIQQRMVWYNISEDAFDWNWERSDDGGETWQVQWTIRYVRRAGS